MKLEKRIELCDSMTPLESEIASYILNNKDAVTKLKIQELADILFILSIPRTQSHTVQH